MGEVIGLGRKRPDGRKVIELRKQKGVKQSDLARRAHISERLLRDIERKNHPVPSTIITALATELKVTPTRSLSRRRATRKKTRSLSYESCGLLTS
jgi:transcriptional regulator with XRE-family HTH domain